MKPEPAKACDLGPEAPPRHLRAALTGPANAGKTEDPMTTTQTTETALATLTNGLPDAMRDTLINTFGPRFRDAVLAIAVGRKIEVTDETQVGAMEAARSARLAIRRIRIDVEAERREMKEASLRTGRAIDAVAGMSRSQCDEAEAELLAKEEFAERAKATKRAALQAEREGLLIPLGVDVRFLNVADMTTDDFERYLADATAAKAAREEKARRDAEAEEKRRADEAKAQAERDAENKRLREEAEKARKAAADAQAKADALKKADDERRAAEDKKKREEANAARRAARAPDRDKVAAYLDALALVPRPTLRDDVFLSRFRLSCKTLDAVLEQMRERLVTNED